MFGYLLKQQPHAEQLVVQIARHIPGCMFFPLPEPLMLELCEYFAYTHTNTGVHTEYLRNYGRCTYSGTLACSLAYCVASVPLGWTLDSVWVGWYAMCRYSSRSRNSDGCVYGSARNLGIRQMSCAVWDISGKTTQQYSHINPFFSFEVANASSCRTLRHGFPTEFLVVVNMFALLCVFGVSAFPLRFDALRLHSCDKCILVEFLRRDYSSG